jgi:hypothetical protein
VGRVRLAVRLGLVSLPLGALVNILTAPDRLAERLAGFGLLMVAYLAMARLTRVRGVSRYAQTLAIGFMLTLGLGLLYLLTQSPTDLDVLGGPVICLMIGSALLFPWQAAGQLAVSCPLAVAYLILAWPHLDVHGMRTTRAGRSGPGAVSSGGFHRAPTRSRARRATATPDRHRPRPSQHARRGGHL